MQQQTVNLCGNASDSSYLIDTVILQIYTVILQIDTVILLIDTVISLIDTVILLIDTVILLIDTVILLIDTVILQVTDRVTNKLLFPGISGYLTELMRPLISEIKVSKTN